MVYLFSKIGIFAMMAIRQAEKEYYVPQLREIPCAVPVDSN